jgi:hypothetical protein
MKKWRLNGLELSLLAAILIVIAVAALFTERDDGGRREPSAERDVSSKIALGRIERRVERLRRLRFKRPLSVSFVGPAQARKLMGSTPQGKEAARDQRVDEEELKLVGLLSASEDLAKSMRAVQEEQVLGFYHERFKRLVIVRQATGGRGLLELTLAHEMVHALEDQHFGVATDPSVSDDRALAESALFEGTATAVMSAYAERNLDLSDLIGLAGAAGAGGDTELPRFVERSLLFPYTEGERFVEALRRRGGWKSLNAVMRLRRPRSSEQILHPSKYASDERPMAPSVPAVGRILGAEWKRLDSTSVGEFDLATLFDLLGDVTGPDAAAGWGGGRFELWRRGTLPDPSCAAPCVGREIGVLVLAWDSERDRVEGERAVTRSVERGLKGDRVPGPAGVGMWSSRGGAVAMVGRGRRTTVVWAPSASLAARVLLHG